MNHLVTTVLAVALMLTGAVMLVTGWTSVLPFAAIAVGIALTVVDGRQHHAAR
jgi:hypothetical protein